MHILAGVAAWLAWCAVLFVALDKDSGPAVVAWFLVTITAGALLAEYGFLW